MPMEKISKYTKFFDLLVIGDEENSRFICTTGLEYFRSMRRIDFSEITSEALSCHILIVNGSLANISTLAIHALAGQIQRLETFLLSDDVDISLYKEALHFRAGYVGKYISNEQEFVTMMLSTLPNVIKKHNESLVSLNYKQVVDHTSHMYWIYRGNKGTFANDAFKEFYGLSALNAFDDSDTAQFLKQISTPEIRELINHRKITESFLVDAHKISDNEVLVEMSPIGGAFKKSEKLFLNRINFIEILKDAFVVHKQESEPIPVIIIMIENEEKVIEEFGEDVYNEICIQIFDMAKKHFNAMANIALWHKDVFTIIDEGVSLDELKKSLERLHENVAAQISVNGATPILDSFVIDMSKLELNKAINIIDHINQRELIASDLSHLVYHEVSFDDKSLDSKDQALHYLEKLFLSKSQVKLLNFYKGIRINTIAQIIKISDGMVYVAIEKIQGYAMQVEKSIVIQATNLPFDIVGEIKIVDIGRKIAVFRNFLPLKVSANSRQHIRIQSDHRMHLTMNALKSIISASILDISIKSIACRVNNSRGIPPIGTLVTLQFHLPSKRSEDGVVSMIVTGNIEFIKDEGEYTKVVVLLDLEEPYESFLIEYLYARQQELISEIKSIVNKL
ncbi:MAG: GGDEF domain-containing protein [Sulfuricurvum sp.]|nr:GGDEF domain-containing protein [Sulfuricurvum sp.]